MRKDYEGIIKRNGCTKAEFAERLSISRPTLNKWLKDYDESGRVPRPYAQDIFDAFFKEERDDVFKTPRFKCLNNNIIVRLVGDTTVNNNGTVFTGSETRGKRDIVKGEIIAYANSNIKKTDILYFSFYAAQPLTLDGEEVYVVNYQDIKFTESRE